MSKKILMLSRLFWPHVGGVEKHVYKLSRELIKKGYEVTIVTEQYDPGLPLRETYQGIGIVRIPYSVLGSKLALWRWVLNEFETTSLDSSLLLRMTFDKRVIFDIVHVHDVFWWLFPFKLLHPRLKIYTTFHGYEGIDPPTWRQVWHRKVVEWLAAKTICVGDFMRKWYKAKPDLVIYGAGDLDQDERLKNKDERFSNKSKKAKAVYVGRLSEDAGIMIYLDALRLLQAQNSKFQIPHSYSLDVYGDGPQRLEAEQYAKKHSLPVAFHGWQEDTTQAIEQADLAFVSRYLAIIEAMQLNTLVVAVYNNAIKHDYLLLHPMADNMLLASSSEEVVEKLNSLDQKRYASLVHNAYTWAHEQTWAKIAYKYERLWNSTRKKLGDEPW